MELCKKRIKLKFMAFTMAEAILVMTILGIIATIMISTLKPAQFKDKGLQIMARKVMSEIDTAITQILINDTIDGDLSYVVDLDNPGSTFIFGAPSKDVESIKLLKKYLSATRQELSDDSFCRNTLAGYKIPIDRVFYLKDGACVGMQSHLDSEHPATRFIMPGEKSVGYMSCSCEDTGIKLLFTIHIDTNGDEKPNALGRDQFIFPIGNRGIIYE